MTNEEINTIWNSLPGLTIHNEAAANGMSTAYVVRIAFARAVLASAAAPQVVADERKGSPYPDYDRGFSNGWDACAKRAAAPVQVQEPVAWRYEWASCITGDGPQNFKLTFDVEPPPEWAVQDGQARNVVKLFGAPVQPVAVQDGDPRPLFDCKLAHLEQRGFEVIGRILHKDGQYALFDSSCRWLEKAQYQRLMHEQDGSLFSAPAAQGDSRKLTYVDIETLIGNTASREFLGWVLRHQKEFNPWPDLVHICSAAIAAKAAS